MAQPGPSSGLSQRRRGAGGGGGGTGADNHNHTPSASSPLASPSLKNRSLAGGGAAAGAGGSSSTSRANGDHHRIAFDPRDLPSASDSIVYPRLTLMEETLLLGLKDKQGYLSFWNDSISYSLRGCILAELLMRRRLRVVRDSSRLRFDVADRLVEVVDAKQTGEVLLDEALKMIKSSEEKRTVADWIDLLSGETWNLSEIGFQLKQVRERLAKGLVDKGVLRTEKRNFLLFDMATHPIADAGAKRDTLRRVHTLICSTSAGGKGASAAQLDRLYASGTSLAALRSLVLVCCAFAANVLDNALLHLTYEARESTFQKVENWLEAFGQWPMAQAFGGIGSGSGGGVVGKGGGGIGAGGARGGPSSLSSSSSSARTAASSGSNSAAASTGGARIAEGSVLAEPDPFAPDGMSSRPGGAGAGGGAGDDGVGVGTADLVSYIRNREADEAGDGMLEGIAGVVAVLGRMDSLL